MYDFDKLCCFQGTPDNICSICIVRSSYVSCKKGVLINSAKFTRKHRRQSLFYQKKRLWHRCFPVSFENFLRTPSFKEHLRWLLLESVSTFFLPRLLLSNWYYRVILYISREKSPFVQKQLTSGKPALNNRRTFTFRFVTFEFCTFDFYVYLSSVFFIC